MSPPEPVGTLVEEAAKLLAALQLRVGDPTGERGEGDDPGQPGGQHAYDPAECEWCPVCRLVRTARATSPEVRAHLSQAVVSLALAVKGLLDDPMTARSETPLEKIDLTEE
jgi:hypothetical protein